MAIIFCIFPIFFIICAIFAAFPLYTGYLPGFLWGVQMSLPETVLSHSLGVESIIGIPIRVIADLLIGFIVFGATLNAVGGSRAMTDLALSTMGRSKAGGMRLIFLPSRTARVASTKLLKLLGKISVDQPTAMPDTPFNKTVGMIGARELRRSESRI